MAHLMHPADLPFHTAQWLHYTAHFRHTQPVRTTQLEYRRLLHPDISFQRGRESFGNQPPVHIGLEAPDIETRRDTLAYGNHPESEYISGPKTDNQIHLDMARHCSSAGAERTSYWPYHNTFLQDTFHLRTPRISPRMFPCRGRTECP